MWDTWSQPVGTPGDGWTLKRRGLVVGSEVIGCSFQGIWEPALPLPVSVVPSPGSQTPAPPSAPPWGTVLLQSQATAPLLMDWGLQNLSPSRPSFFLGSSSKACCYNKGNLANTFMFTFLQFYFILIDKCTFLWEWCVVLILVYIEEIKSCWVPHPQCFLSLCDKTI